MARQRRPRLEDILGPVKKGRLEPVYLLTGAETWMVHEVSRAVRRAVLGDEASDWNEDRLRATDVDGSQVVLSCNTPPVGQDRRLVRVAGIERWKEKDTSAVAAYLADPAPTAVLVLVGLKLDGRSKLAKAANKAGVAVKFEALRERELPPLIQRMARDLEKKVDARAVQMLIARVGTSLEQLNSELTKLALYVGDRAAITVEDVAEAAAGEGSANIFALCDAVGDGNTQKALQLLEAEMTGDRSAPIRVNAMLARHLRLLTRARTATGSLAQALGLPPFIADQYGRQARNFETHALEEAHRLVYRADRDLKGGSRLPPRDVISRLVLELCAVA